MFYLFHHSTFIVSNLISIRSLSLSLSFHQTDKISTALLLWFSSIFVLFAENIGLHFDDSFHVVQHHLTLGLSTWYKQNSNPHFNTIWFILTSQSNLENRKSTYYRIMAKKLISLYIPYNHITGNFRNDLIFTFFLDLFSVAINWICRNNICIISCKKLFKMQKMTNAN